MRRLSGRQFPFPVVQFVCLSAGLPAGGSFVFGTGTRTFRLMGFPVSPRATSECQKSSSNSRKTLLIRTRSVLPAIPSLDSPKSVVAPQKLRFPQHFFVDDFPHTLIQNFGVRRRAESSARIACTVSHLHRHPRSHPKRPRKVVTGLSFREMKIQLPFSPTPQADHRKSFP